MAKKLVKKTSNDATMYQQLDAEPMFAGVKTNEGIIITCGKYRVSAKTFKTFEEANEYVASKPYEILINVSVLFSKITNDESKEPSKENPQSKQ